MKSIGQYELENRLYTTRSFEEQVEFQVIFVFKVVEKN